MSYNDSNQINSSNIGNDEFKYYYENDSGNVTYEDIDTCILDFYIVAHSRGRELHEMTSHNINHEIITNLLNSRTDVNNIVSVSNNNLIPLNSEITRPVNHLSRSFVNHANNVFENSNMNSDLNLNSSSPQNHDTGESQIDEMFEQFTYAISTEKLNLRNDRANLTKEKNKFNDMKTVEIQKLHKEREEWNQKIKIADDSKYKESDILDLDIGGTQKISTTRGTLIKYPNSALAELFSGGHQINSHNGRYFLDRDGNVFIHVLNFLSNSSIRIGSSKLPVFKSRIDENAFLEELEFWQIDFKQDYEPVLSYDPDWVANTLILDDKNLIVKKQNAHHGIVFLKTQMDVYHNFVEFKVTMNIPSKGKNHLFVGLVDKSKYKYDHLMSTFWKDSPSSYYWDVWNSKIIKTDENGIQNYSIGGYGCPCEGILRCKLEYETRISILYDYKTRTLSFEKNGVNQGIAFKNVSSGLTPSLDIWFESGSVEILKDNRKSERIFL